MKPKINQPVERDDEFNYEGFFQSDLVFDFNNKISSGYNQLGLTNEPQDEKQHGWLSLLAKSLLYFTGTFLLYGATVVLFWNHFSYQPDTMACLGMVLLGGVMMILGIGNIRNPKHLLIPASVILLTAILFLVSSVIGDQNFMQDISYYLFPLVFCLPILTKELYHRSFSDDPTNLS